MVILCVLNFVSLRKHIFLTQSLRTYECVEPESNNIVTPVFADLPSVVCNLPNAMVIGGVNVRRIFVVLRDF